MGKDISLLLIGSMIGGAARYFLTEGVHRFFSREFPHGTLFVNVIGCFIIGFLFYFSESRFHLNQTMRLFLITGFCGAFTTFATLMLEVSHLLNSGQIGKVFVYISISLVLGFGAFQIGSLAGKAL